ncbi:hypothetical protein [Chryseoglobus sp. 28M-23]|jgi:hypothetical protein|uniref:hypothetical protein n=1 Tax=Chryseoglobus sp. 28M-23 TaxID=2772253 RepID=UPI001746881F|nr:hypothetical protein [Chryseoglobus sp. 28M-23]QOD93189.1 hypothetical protein IE160_09670 [Chryseoglobus sp. 28M-23]
MAARAARDDTAPRPRRYRDPRLLIGLLLVAGSVLGVVGVVAAVDDGVEVYAAPRLLTVGEHVDASDLELRRVSLGPDSTTYLRGGQLPEGGVIVSRSIGSGELVPLSAVGDVRGASSTTIVVSLATDLGGTVRAGDLLDLWSAPALEAGRYGAPTVLASGAQLVRSVAQEGIVSGAEAARVELLVPRREVARILHAVANGDALSVIPVSLAVGP